MFFLRTWLLVVCVTDCLTDIRQSLAVPRLIAVQSDGGTVGGPSGGATASTGGGLGELLRDMHTSLVSQLKSVLIHLQVSHSLSCSIFALPLPLGCFPTRPPSYNYLNTDLLTVTVTLT